MVTATQSLSDDMIELFAAEIGAHDPHGRPRRGAGGRPARPARPRHRRTRRRTTTRCRSRPPVITVMGHVDHGKTKLLDQIRNTNVVGGRGRWHHPAHRRLPGRVKDGHPITFIDTPGHEAFTAMRARGAEATDIVVLVVAADDGVMPQTLEAIQHARGGRGADRGGDQQDRPGRGRSRTGSCSSSPSAGSSPSLGWRHDHGRGLGAAEPGHRRPAGQPAGGVRGRGPPGRRRTVGPPASVLESNLDIGRGPVATVLVQRGTLRVGDPVVAGAAWGRVRALIDDKRQAGQGGRSVHPGADPRACPRWPKPATTSSWRRARRSPGRWPRPVSTGSARRRWAACRTSPPVVPVSRTSSCRSRPARPPRSTSSSRPT